MARVALVTGANKGIGLQIVRDLCKKFEGTVLLAARSLQRGEEAKKTLETEGLHPVVLELDLDNAESIRLARDVVKDKYGRLDVLVNNAGVYIRPTSGKSFDEIAFLTVKTNYHGLRNVTSAFAPLLQANSRVINISSALGKMWRIGPKRQQEILDPNLTIEQLSVIMDGFVEDAKSLDYNSKGWMNRDPEDDNSNPAYTVSKIGVSRLTELLVETIGKDPSRPGMLINAVHPGWVRTEMGTSSASQSVEEGADTAVYLALLPPATSEPNGQLLQNRAPIDWKSTSQK